MKGCPLCCIWCSNPESQVQELELVFYGEKCIKSNKCWQVCPTNAISIKDNRLALDKQLCNLCGSCVETCYAGAWKMFGINADLEYVIKEIEKDAVFYKNSGGGVTFGGGEPMLYPEFINAVASKCRNEDIPVAIETCGLVPWRNFEQILNKVDLVMFDIKHMDPRKHKEYCGHSNRSILKNLECLSQSSDVEVIVRVPIIPGLNDSEDNIRKIIKFVASLKGNIRGIELLPYHKFGESKYSRLGRKYTLAEIKVPSDEHMQKIKSMMIGNGIDIKIGG